jgi:sulfopyruvate decarboxylase subunit alpha
LITNYSTIKEYLMTVSEKIVADFVANDVEFITTVPCKQLAGVIDAVEANSDIYHIPSNKEDEGMGLCAGAYMGGKRPAIIMQNTAIGVTVNTLVTLTQYYRMPLPMLISYRGELREPVACQAEMAVHTKALLNQLNIPTYHFHKEDDVEEFDAILKYTYMCNKPVAILTDASFWGGYGE